MNLLYTLLLLWGLPFFGCVAQDTGETEDALLNAEMLYGKSFRFSWKCNEEGGFNGVAFLKKDGTIHGIGSPNESYWLVDEKGRLLFKHKEGRVSSIFDKVERTEDGFRFQGIFTFKEGILHFLEEITDGSAFSPIHCISPEDAERIAYSKQIFIYLDPGESYAFKLKDGSERVIRLVSVEEPRDKVVNLMRRALVHVKIDGKPLTLVCSPFVMPTETAGLRILADTTTAWIRLPKQVQFSLWDAADPVVDTSIFKFPFRTYRLFTHGCQAYNEPVHIGRFDGDPKGGCFYHNYGFDMAGYEGREEVFSSIDGVIVRLLPEGNPSNMSIQDERGFIIEYCHLDSVHPEIKMGVKVKRGQPIGILGRRGPSGNFAHLHMGGYTNRAHLDAGRNNRNFNLFPWLMTAFEEEYKFGLYALAQPHKVVYTGEKVVFHGEHSLAFGSKITSYKWVFHDGESKDGPVAEKVFDKPGLYMAALWVEDNAGRKDVDFCKVKVFTKEAREDAIPTIFMSYTPSLGIRTGQLVYFRCWLQWDKEVPFKLDFGDGQSIAGYSSYTELRHAFSEPGMHIVAASAIVEGIPVTQKVKVYVEEES